jgi:hypothetical protein
MPTRDLVELESFVAVQAREARTGVVPVPSGFMGGEGGSNYPLWDRLARGLPSAESVLDDEQDTKAFGCGCADHADRVPSDLHGLSSHLRSRPSGRAGAASMTESQPVLYSERVRLGDPLVA